MKRHYNKSIVNQITPHRELPDWMLGWQKDGSFLGLNQDDTIKAPPNIKLLATPVAIPSRSLINEITPSDQTQNSYAMLAIVAALTAPFLYPLGQSGICIHFYGNSVAARQALLYSASTVWKNHIYDFKDVRGHIPGLKIFHKDSALCLNEVPHNRTNDMRKFLRRYFLGRKGFDPGINGVVISTGETPLAYAEDQEKGLKAFVENGRIFGIDIELGAWPPNYAVNIERSILPELIHHIRWNADEFRMVVRSEQSRVAKYRLKPKGTLESERAASVLWLLNGIAYYIADKGGLKWWTGGDLPSKFCRFIDEVDGQTHVYMSLLHRIANRLPRTIQFGDYNTPIPTPFVLLKHNRVLIPATEMNLIIPSRALRCDFTHWLKINRVLIPQQKTKLCGAFYSPNHKKTIRSYLIDARQLYQLLSFSA